MASSAKTERPSTAAAEATLAKVLAPEEIRLGDFVTPLFVIAELPSFWWCLDAWNRPLEEPVRIRFTPSAQGAPLKVRSVCLPFVLVKSPAGEQATLDLRNCQLARLDKMHAKRAWKAFKKTAHRVRAKAQ
jgi:hypothetical protein